LKLRIPRRLLDLLLWPCVVPAALLLKHVRRVGLQHLPAIRWTLKRLGVLPVRNHYFEPLFDERELRGARLDDPRELPGVNWNESGQLELMSRMPFAAELADLPRSRPNELGFYLENGSFGSPDAEFLYNMVRLKKPRRFFEIGSGHSTLIVRRAIRRNMTEDPSYACEHLCVEPYEIPWLERLGIRVVRQRVEELPLSFFDALGEDDFLFIDSSHIIRPRGDVLYEYLQLLPSLNPGVIVHIHDVFSPRDYLREMLFDVIVLWNEQYLMEAMLINNPDWKVLAALNFLHHSHFERLQAVCPFHRPGVEPRSFYVQRRLGR
jgi:predicted O-methyltransferase YrrM